MLKKLPAEILLKRSQFLRKQDKIADSYDVAPKALATGSFGEVRVCTHKLTKDKRAVKIVPKYKLKNVDNFLNEIDLMRLVVYLL